MTCKLQANIKCILFRPVQNSNYIFAIKNHKCLCGTEHSTEVYFDVLLMSSGLRTGKDNGQPFSGINHP